MDVNAVFDAFGRFSDLVQLRDNLDRKAGQLRSVTAHRCGNCDHWMKTTCIPEKKLGQFKDCESPGCGSFTPSPNARRSAAQFNVELEEMRQRLANFTQGKSEKP